MSMEYRVVWKRAGCVVKRKRYRYRKNAEKWITLLGPEPWTTYGRAPDDLQCCNGRECACGGVTVREHSDEIRATLPAIEWIRLDSRPVGQWEPAGTLSREK